MNFVAINRYNNRRYQVNAQHWPEHGWHFQILEPGAWGRSPTGIGDGPVIDQGFQKQLEQRGWTFTPAEPITPENAVNKVGPLPEPENIRDRAMKDLAARFKPKTESRASQIVSALLDGIDPTELAMGRKVEREHTASPRRAEAIAKDHLEEPGHRRYYTRLKKAGLANELTKPKASFYPSMGSPSSV